MRSIPILLALFALLCIVSPEAGCNPAKAPREQARSVVLTIAEAVHMGDLSCASVSMATRDVHLADVCAALVAQARDSLIGAEDVIDGWGAAEENNLPCAVRDAAEALGRLGSAIRSAGGKIPPVVDDALRLAPLLTEACRG